jgi:hypothetical protein
VAGGAETARREDAERGVEQERPARTRIEAGGTLARERADDARLGSHAHRQGIY